MDHGPRSGFFSLLNDKCQIVLTTIVLSTKRYDLYDFMKLYMYFAIIIMVGCIKVN